ncbi:MAG: isoprenylcysteine carboxylmethyltransferase family protein [Proteobacteria bacterium]|nr:isoprenylcysteine carboxylmethyltransferase family protein [Pseudomonadota bacterium]
MPDLDTPPKSWLIGYGEWIFRTRNWAFPLFMLALFAGFKPVPYAADPSADIWFDAIGVAVALTGSLYRAWVIGLAYIKRGGVDRKVYADNLVTTGMFGVCRNPLYVGNALVLVGLFLVHNNPWLYLLGGLVFGVSYWAIVTTEETYLRERFGHEYEEYCARVNRFLPNFSRYAQSAEGHRFSWRRAVSKDHGSVVIWMLAAIALYIYEQATWSPISLDSRDVSLSIIVSLVVIAVWGLIRILKKSGAFNEVEDA